MPSVRAEMIRQGLDRWGTAASGTDDQEVRVAIEELVSGYHADCKLDFTRTLPDFPPARGPEAMVKWMESARTTLGEVTFTPGDMVEAGDTLVVPVRVSARTRDSGALIQMDYAYVFRFRGDKIAAATSYLTLAEALEAATSTP